MNKPDIMNTWLSNMKIKNFYPTSNDVLCSDHFERNCFLRHGQRKSLQLKRNAIPTIFTRKCLNLEDYFFKYTFKYITFEEVKN